MLVQTEKVLNLDNNKGNENNDEAEYVRDDDGNSNDDDIGTNPPPEQEEEPQVVAPVRKTLVSPGRISMLESLSYEIMTRTLPVQKLKRVIPDEPLPVKESWPILSNYRKQTILPQVS